MFAGGCFLIVAIRPKDECLEDKRARKQAIKEQRRVRIAIVNGCGSQAKPFGSQCTIGREKIFVFLGKEVH